MESNILFIDDESAVLDAIKWTFADEPYGCLTCKTPEEALRLMEEINFAVVVSDQRMPDMNGTDFLEKIKHQWPSTIRILMTAYQEMNIILDAVNKGHIYNLIFKPWNERELKRIIKTAVDDYTLRNTYSISKQVIDQTGQLLELTQSLERKNHNLLARLQEAQKMETLGNLASGIAHDFNNILLIINGCIKLSMYDKSLAPNVHSHLRQALEASDRAKELISQILTFSSPGKKNKKPVKLGPLVEEVLKFIQTTVPINIEIRSDIRVTYEKIRLEPTKVYQIIMNLCQNAVDAMNDIGIVYIDLTRTRIEQTKQVEQMKLLPGDYFCLTVRDTGDGIEEENLERIFDPYFTTKRNHGGTGLGLSLINRIVQDHGGRITVKSEKGKGSGFIVYLPLIDDSQTMSFT